MDRHVALCPPQVGQAGEGSSEAAPEGAPALEGSQQLLLPRLHVPALRCLAIVIAEQVQQPVDEQQLHLAGPGMAVAGCLLAGPLQGNGDVTQVGGALLQHDRGWLTLLPHAEGDDVGGLVASQVLPVEDPDPLIVGQDDTNLAGFGPLQRQDPAGKAPQAGQARSFQPGRLDPDLHLVAHRVASCGRPSLG